MARFGEINAQYFDDAGDPLGSGKLYFYDSGTTTPKVTYADINLTIPNTNPVILTAAGRQPNIFFNGNAKAILADKNDVQILVRDPVGETGTNFGDPWTATKIYSSNAVVIGSDGVYYRSLDSGNQNNNPTTTSGFWTLLYSVDWNSGITYQTGAMVTVDGEQYQSLQDSNLGNDPTTSPAYWVLLSFAWLATATYAQDQNAVGTDGVLYTSLQNSNTGNDPATSPAYWVGTSAAAAASATAAAASATAAAASETAAETAETNAANSATASASSATDSANSATASASSATASATSASESASSAAAAATSETNAATSAADAAATYDQFDDRYLGVKSSDPATDNDGNPLVTGALYFSSTTNTMRVYNGSGWQDTASITTSVSLSQISDFPSQTGQSGKFLTTNGSVPSWDEVQTDPTKATLSQTFAQDQAVSISLSSSINSGVPVVSIAKEIPQTGFTNNNWDVSGTNYELQDYATATTLTPSNASADGTFTLGTGAFTSDNIGMVIEGNGGKAAITAADGSYKLITNFNNTNAIVSGDWTMEALQQSADGVTLGGYQVITQNNTDATPTMTSNTAPAGYSVSGSTVSSSAFDFYMAFDNAATTWKTATGQTTGYITFTFPSPVTIWKYSITSEYFTAAPSDWTLRNGNQSGTIIDTQSGENWVSYQIKTFTLATPSTGTSFTLNVTANNGHPNILWIREIQYFDETTSNVYIDNQYLPAISPQIDTTFWLDINSMTPTETLNDGEVYYALSADNRATWSVVKSLYGTRNIAKNNAGTWQYNTNTTYGSETWVNATINNEYDAISESMEAAIGVTEGYSVETATNTGTSFSFTSFSPSCYGFRIGSNGTKIYSLSTTNDSVYQSTMTTAWDISTASYDSVSFSVASQELTPVGIDFKSDGTEFYVVGVTSDTVYQYSLSTAWDLSSASYSSKSFSVNSQELSPYTLRFSSDGTKMYVLGVSSDTIFEYDLSSAWDVSTASYNNASFPVNNLGNNTGYSMEFNYNGTILLVGTVDSSKKIFKFYLTTAWDITSAVNSFEESPTLTVTGIYDFQFNQDGTTLLINDFSNLEDWTIETTPYLNQMNATQLQGTIDSDQISLNNELNLATILYTTDGTGYAPLADGASINYDANSLWQGAIIGTDVNWDFPASDTTRVTALIAGNYKVRIM